MCSILSDLITSTMKSEFGLPARCGMSFGTAVSLAICCTLRLDRGRGNRFTSAAPVPGAACHGARRNGGASHGPHRPGNFDDLLQELSRDVNSLRAISKPL